MPKLTLANGLFSRFKNSDVWIATIAMEVLPRLLRNELLYMLVGKKKKVWQEFINSKIISKTKKQEEDSIKKQFY